MTPEGRIKEAIKSELKKLGVYYHMPVQNGMGKPTLDFVCCHQGYFFAIEAKAPGKKPTARQELTIAEMRRAGGKVYIVDSSYAIHEMVEDLRYWC